MGRSRLSIKTSSSVRIRAGLLGVFLVSMHLLTACMFAGAPKESRASVSDAVPRYEPLSAYGNPPFYRVAGRSYHVLPSAEGYVERGIASWYGPDFHGKRASSGETYNMYDMTAAHPTLPLPSYVKVTNLQTGQTAIVRVNDRGPFKSGRIIDLSYAAARKVGVWANGTAQVEVRAVFPNGREAQPRYAKAEPHGNPPTPTLAQQRFPADIFVQVGAFSEFANAFALKTHVTDLGIGYTFISPTSGDGLYRVRIGPIADPEVADMTVAALHGHGLYGARLVVEHRGEVNLVRDGSATGTGQFAGPAF